MSEARTLPEPSPLARPLLESPSPARALLESHFFRAPLRRAPPFLARRTGGLDAFAQEGVGPTGGLGEGAGPERGTRRRPRRRRARKGTRRRPRPTYPTRLRTAAATSGAFST